MHKHTLLSGVSVVLHGALQAEATSRTLPLYLTMNREDLKELSYAHYWDERYTKERTEPHEDDSDSYEWFRTFAKLRPFLEKHLPKPLDLTFPRILHLGNGTSTLPADLFSFGYHNQVSIDFSAIAVDTMRSRHADLGSSLEWLVRDVRNMQFSNQSFDVAIDKGTLDAMLHGSLWDPEDEVRENVSAYVNEVARVLKPGGKWLYVSYRQPHFLKPLLARESVWKIEVETLQDSPGSFEYFGFVMTKHI